MSFFPSAAVLLLKLFPIANIEPVLYIAPPEAAVLLVNLEYPIFALVPLKYTAPPFPAALLFMNDVNVMIPSFPLSQ